MATVSHLALAVSNQERSPRFYETYFGSAQSPQGAIPTERFSFLHFGFPTGSRESVHTFRERLRADGVEIVEESDEPSYVSVKCRDPDGYVVETAWEATEQD